MKTRNLLLSILMLALAIPAQAQLNLNKLGKQVKKAAEKKVEQTMSEKKSDVTQTVVEETEKHSPISSKGTSCSNVEPDEGEPDSYLGVPIGKNVYRHYNQLDKDIYNMWGEANSQYWYRSAEESLEWLNSEMFIFLYALAAAQDEIPMVVRNQGGALIPVGEMSINAYFGLFSALPEAAYPFFVKGRAILKLTAEGKLRDDYTKINAIKAIIKEENSKVEIYFNPSPYMKYGYGFSDGSILDPFDKYEGKRVERWKTEEARLMKLYSECVSYNAVKNTVLNLFVGTASATKEKNWIGATVNSYMLDVLIKDMMEHPDRIEDEEYDFAIETYNKWSVENFPKWRAEVYREWNEFYNNNQELFMGAISIPKAAISDPKLEAEMLVIAKTIFDDGRVPVKAIIKNKDWDYDRTPLGQIINRFQTAYIIYKMPDGTHRMVDIGFKQMYNGGSYGKTQSRGIGLVNQVVEYNQ